MVLFLAGCSKTFQEGKQDDSREVTINSDFTSSSDKHLNSFSREMQETTSSSEVMNPTTSDSIKENSQMTKESEKTTVSSEAVVEDEPMSPVFGEPRVLSEPTVATESNSELVDLIVESMKDLSPSNLYGPAKWSVAISHLTDSKKKAYVTNWAPGEAQYSASTIKIFILITTYQQFKDGILSRDDVYSLKEEDRVLGSGIMLEAKNGTEYTIEELCHLMIQESDNIATNVLIDQVGGFERVNQTITNLFGINHKSSLQRYMMDTSNIKDGYANRINAQEAAETMLKLWKGEIVDNDSSKEMLEILSKTKNRSKLPAKLPSEAKVWNKTGESNYRGIENDLALISYQGEVFAVCALVQLDGNDQEPEIATQEQTDSQIHAIANLGSSVTNWMVLTNHK